jgi:amino acid transporter
MQTQHIVAEGEHRTFRIAVWIGRAIGWALLLIAILGIAAAELLPSVMGAFELVPCLAVGLMAVIWIVGFELFLRFFDRYLSGN